MSDNKTYVNQQRELGRSRPALRVVHSFGKRHETKTTPPKISHGPATTCSVQSLTGVSRESHDMTPLVALSEADMEAFFDSLVLEVLRGEEGAGPPFGDHEGVCRGLRSNIQIKRGEVGGRGEMRVFGTPQRDKPSPGKGSGWVFQVRPVDGEPCYFCLRPMGLAGNVFFLRGKGWQEPTVAAHRESAERNLPACERRRR